MKKTLKRHGTVETVTTDGLRSYCAAMKELGCEDKQEIGGWANNRVENSHLPFRRRERAMLRFRQMKSRHEFASVHAKVCNHCNLERHLIDRETYKERRSAALADGGRSRAEASSRHDLVVVSDEVYEAITYDEAQHISIASLPGMRERIIVLFVFTKAYAMNGWRLGYAVADRVLMPGLMTISMSALRHVNTFIQAGGAAALRQSQEPVRAMVAEDASRRDIVVQALNQMPGVTCASPEGTIYVFPNIAGMGISSQKLTERLLNRAHVVVEAGTFYGPAGEGHLKICYGSETTARITAAVDRLTRFFNDLLSGCLTWHGTI